MNSPSHLSCLSTVFEFASLVELHANLAPVNRFWLSVAREAPLRAIDTVGYSVDLSVLKETILSNQESLEEIRVSVVEMADFLKFLIHSVPDIKNLRKLELYTACSDGSVRGEIVQNHFGGVGFSLVLQVDDESPFLIDLIQLLAPKLTHVYFLRGCPNLYPTEKDLLIFLLANPQMVEIHLGHCAGSIDMDAVIPQLLTQSGSLKYLQWSHASASLALMQTLIKHPRIKFSFDSIGFLSWFSSQL